MDRKQQELVAKVFDGNMLPDGTVEVRMVMLCNGDHDLDNDNDDGHHDGDYENKTTCFLMALWR